MFSDKFNKQLFLSHLSPMIRHENRTYVVDALGNQWLWLNEMNLYEQVNTGARMTQQQFEQMNFEVGSVDDDSGGGIPIPTPPVITELSISGISAGIDQTVSTLNIAGQYHTLTHEWRVKFN